MIRLNVFWNFHSVLSSGSSSGSSPGGRRSRSGVGAGQAGGSSVPGRAPDLLWEVGRRLISSSFRRRHAPATRGDEPLAHLRTRTGGVGGWRGATTVRQRGFQRKVVHLLAGGRRSEVGVGDCPCLFSQTSTCDFSLLRSEQIHRRVQLSHQRTESTCMSKPPLCARSLTAADPGPVLITICSGARCHWGWADSQVTDRSPARSAKNIGEGVV